MVSPPQSFEALLAPIAPAEFLESVRLQAPLHVPAPDPERFAGVMSWADLTALVNQSSIWSPASLHLVHHNRRLAAEEYCRRERTREGADGWVPDLERVRGWLASGASLVLNDIAELTPGVKQVARLLAETLGAKVQANLYCSWQAEPGFGSHFDVHEVFALHVAGRKTWRIYGRHIEDPIAHPRFRTLGQDFHERHKGPLGQEVRMAPGDLLYIPRGWYHDALAESAGTIHVAFGVIGPIGLDFLSLLYERAVEDPLFRRTVPGEPAARDAHVAALAERLAALAGEDAVRRRFAESAAGFRHAHAELTLPDDVTGAPAADRADRADRADQADPGARTDGSGAAAAAGGPPPDGATGGARRYEKTAAEGVRVARARDRWVLTDGRQGAPIPEGLEKPVAWVLERPRFAEVDMAAAFPSVPAGARRALLDQLVRMQVLREVSVS